MFLLWCGILNRQAADFTDLVSSHFLDFIKSGQHNDSRNGECVGQRGTGAGRGFLHADTDRLIIDDSAAAVVDFDGAFLIHLFGFVSSKLVVVRRGQSSSIDLLLVLVVATAPMLVNSFLSNKNIR